MNTRSLARVTNRSTTHSFASFRHGNVGFASEFVAPIWSKRHRSASKYVWRVKLNHTAPRLVFDPNAIVVRLLFFFEISLHTQLSKSL
jgi:hypothetical protein